MTGQMGFRVLLDTKPTLKWFIVIGFIMIVLGVVLSFFSILGIILAWIGIFFMMLSVIALFYLWVTERYLPQPGMGRR
jgi:hypothetical protein